MYALLENTFKLFAMITIVLFFLPLKIVRELTTITFAFTGLTTIRTKPSYRYVTVRTKRHHSFGY